MLNSISKFCHGLFLTLMTVVVLTGLGGFEAQAQGLADAVSDQGYAQPAQTLIAYSIDYEMDRARGDKTIEHYGEPVRDVVEQTLRNNVNHPDSKDTAKNSYGRKSFLNDLLPNRNSAGKKFSQGDFSEMRKTDHPRDVLQK